MCASALSEVWFFKSPVMLCDYVFTLIPSVGYGAASDCPQLLTVLPLCARRAVILPYADSVPFLQLCDV